MAEFDFKSLTPEQKEKLKSLKSREELLKFIEEQNIELTNEQMNEISGGKSYWEKYVDAVYTD